MDLSWQEFLSESRLEESIQEEGSVYCNCVYTPIVTLWTMVSQVLDPDSRSLYQDLDLNGVVVANQAYGISRFRAKP